MKATTSSAAPVGDSVGRPKEGCHLAQSKLNPWTELDVRMKNGRRKRTMGAEIDEFAVEHHTRNVP